MSDASMRLGLWWNWLLWRVFNYLQSFRRGVWCNSFGGDVDRSAIDSFRTERPDPCNYCVVPSERLRYVRQAKALLSIISFILRKKRKKLRECINVKDFLKDCVEHDVQSSMKNTEGACFPRCHLHWHAIPYTLRHHKRDFSLVSAFEDCHSFACSSHKQYQFWILVCFPSVLHPVCCHVLYRFEETFNKTASNLWPVE